LGKKSEKICWGKKKEKKTGPDSQLLKTYVHDGAVRTPSRSSNAVAQFEHRRAVRTPSRSSNAVAQFHHRRAV
jgi:hypothetical protein